MQVYDDIQNECPNVRETETLPRIKSLSTLSVESTVQCWCQDDEECWKLMKFREVVEDHVIFSGREIKTGKRYSFEKSNIHFFEPSHSVNLDNISDMNSVHEGPLLDLLRRRYHQKDIYTWTGDILISLNPYDNIPGLYTRKSSTPIRQEAAPHLHAVAARAWQAVEANSKETQVIIINGESGAGKTEASKHLIRYFSSQTEADNFGDKVLSQLIATNLVLEEFGNSKTVRNDNSSRFGKYIRLAFDKKKVVGAHISYFLLETSRIVARSHNERNYHIFYSLCGGVTDEERSLFGIKPSTAYNYLIGNASIADRDDRESLNSIKNVFAKVGLSTEVVHHVFQVLAAILELGNIIVEVDCIEDSHVRMGKVEKDQESVLQSANLLGLDPDILSSALSSRVVRSNSARASISKLGLSPEQTSDSINSLAKVLYERLFDWLVTQMNKKTASSEIDTCIGILDIYGFEILEKNSLEQLCINFANERLQRQFNSKVFDSEQERYISEGIDWEISKFGSDNQPCIDLIGMSKLSVMSVLDEQSLIFYHARGIATGNLVNASEQFEEQYLAKLAKAHHQKHPNYIKSRIAGTTFSIKHFAGVVQYEVSQFPHKNMDSLHSDLVVLLSQSSESFVRVLFAADAQKVFEEHSEHILNVRQRTFRPNEEEDTPVAVFEKPHSEVISDNLFSSGKMNQIKLKQTYKSFAAKNTVSMRFRLQLDCLMHILDRSRPHYIRCIKPNNMKIPDKFDSSLVLQQLRYIGVVETVRIRRVGYPVQLSYESFFDTFGNLLTSGKVDCDVMTTDGVSDMSRTQVKEALSRLLEADMWQLGNHNIFLKDRQVDVLHSQIRKLKVHSASTLQAAFRRITQQRIAARIHAENQAITKLQAVARMRPVYRQFQHHVRQCRKIQSAFRLYHAFKLYDKAKASILVIQIWNRKLMKSRREKAAMLIQAPVRVLLAKRRILKLRIQLRTAASQAAGATLLQKTFKGFISRKNVYFHREGKQATSRIQVAVKSYLRNLILARMISRLFETARSGDVQKMKHVCTSTDRVEGVRERKSLATLLHAAIESGNLEMCEYIIKSKEGSVLQRWSVEESLDGSMNTLLHYALNFHEQSRYICEYLLQIVGQTSDAAMTKDTTPINMEGVLMKRKLHSKFHKRHVVLDTDKCTLTYYKKPKDATPRFAINLRVSCGTILKISDQFPNCFEIHSPELLSKCKEGRLYFACKTQEELQRWVSAIRSTRGISFQHSLPVIDYIEKGALATTSWHHTAQYICKQNTDGRTALHLSYKCDIDVLNFLLSMASPRVHSLIRTRDNMGKTASQYARARTDITSRLIMLAKLAQGEDEIGRKSIPANVLTSNGSAGGTFLSLILGDMVLPKPRSCSAPVLSISVNSMKTSNPSSRQRCLTEEKFLISPIEMDKFGASTRLAFDSVWHMQTPFEQLAEGTILYAELFDGKEVIARILIPLSAKAISIGDLSVGVTHSFTLAPPLKERTIVEKAVDLLTKKKMSPKSDANEGVHWVLKANAYLSVRSEPCQNLNLI